MKVYILTQQPFPYGWAAVNRIKCYSQAIQGGGLECEVLICKRPKTFDEVHGNNSSTGSYNGIRYRYITGTTKRSKNRIISHICDYIDLWKAERYLKSHLKEGDVLFLYMNKPVEEAIRYNKIAHKLNALCIRELCELPYGASLETIHAIQGRKKTLDKLFPLLDGIVCISDALLDLAKKHVKSSCKLIKVPILVDFEKYKLEDLSQDVKTPFIFHSGTLFQQKDGILGMIEAFGIVAKRMNKPVKFISTGSVEKTRSMEKEEITRLIKEYDLKDKIKFTGYLTDEQLKEYLSQAALVIINKLPTQQNTYCFSTKLGEYMAAAKPVIITNVGEAMNWLSNGDNAYIVETGDTESLANAIEHIFENPEEARRIGLAGQDVCHNSFDYHVWSEPLVAYIKSLGK